MTRRSVSFAFIAASLHSSSRRVRVPGQPPIAAATSGAYDGTGLNRFDSRPAERTHQP